MLLRLQLCIVFLALGAFSARIVASDWLERDRAARWRTHSERAEALADSVARLSLAAAGRSEAHELSLRAVAGLPSVVYLRVVDQRGAVLHETRKPAQSTIAVSAERRAGRSRARHSVDLAVSTRRLDERTALNRRAAALAAALLMPALVAGAWRLSGLLAGRLRRELSASYRVRNVRAWEEA